MKQMNKSRITPLLMAAALLFSCAEEEGSREATTPARFSIDTRAEAGTAYRIAAYNNSTNAGVNQYGLVKSGTYYFAAAGDKALTNCKVDVNGERIAGEPDPVTESLNGLSGSHFLVCVSPGLPHKIDGDKNDGFACTPSLAAKPFLVANQGARLLGGYGILSMSNLVDYRSRVGFRFYRKKDVPDEPNVQSFTVEQVQLVGAGADGEAVTLYPATRQVVATSTPRAVTMTATPVTDPPAVDPDGNPQCYFTASENLLYIASAKYAPKEVVRGSLGNTPSIHLKESGYLYMACTLNQGGRVINIRLPLTNTRYDLLPLTTYYFNITVMSNYITATMSIINGSTTSGWREHGDEEENIIDGSPDIDFVPIGTWQVVGEDDTWKEVDLGQAID
ncbi:MAG: hypothetical protein LBP56_09985 [Odoribacteraceae bacterium]|jgi:hypothetical protein|nr:hypothetical protein [Odoribacteraceae bacterium]